MKKAAVHIFFWLGYWCLLAYFERLWMKEYIHTWPADKMMVKSFAASLIYGLPHSLLAYYIGYYALPAIVRKKSGVITNLGMILLPYLAAICMVILLARQLVLPYIYEGVVTPRQGFFEPQHFFSIMIEAAFPAALLIAVEFVNTLLAAKEKEKNLEKEKLVTELKLLKNQLHPHFLFNTLNNIYALTRKKSDQAPEVVLKLSELLSFMLYEAGNDRISIAREVQFLEDYITLQKIRYTDELQLTFHKNIDHEGELIAPLLLLPLVENAFKHGAGENHFNSFIHISLHLEKAQLSFKIENSFEGAAEPARPAAIGLHNIVRQLELVYSEQKLDISNKDAVFTVELTINLNSYGKNELPGGGR